MYLSQCIYLHLIACVVIYAERGGWAAEQKAVCFVLLVAVVGIRRWEMDISVSTSTGKMPGGKGEARHVAETWQQKLSVIPGTKS